MSGDKIIKNAIRSYRLPRVLYRRLPRHNLLPGGCSNGKLYPLGSNPDNYLSCLKCGILVNKDLATHYGIEMPSDLPPLKDFRVNWESLKK